MTTMSVGTQMVRVRARYATERMSVIDAQDYLYDLGCLMLVGYLLGNDYKASAHGYVRLMHAKQAEGIAIDAANDTRVRSISYNSPLEVVLTLSSAGVAVTLVGERLVRLYREIQETRAMTAGVSTRLMRERIVQRHLEQYLTGTTEQTNRWVEGAARASSTIEHLEVEPDYE